MKKFLLSAVASSVIATGLFANGLYVGIGSGQSDSDLNTSVQSGASLDEKDTSYQAFVGYSFNDFIAVEANYNDFGESTLDFDSNGQFTVDGYTFNPGVDGRVKTKTKAYGISAVASYPLHKYFVPFAKFGIQRYKISATSETTIGYDKTKLDGYDYNYGVGFNSNINDNFATRVSYEKFEMEDNLDVENLAFSLIYKFNTK